MCHTETASSEASLLQKSLSIFRALHFDKTKEEEEHCAHWLKKLLFTESLSYYEFAICCRYLIPWWKCIRPKLHSKALCPHQCSLFRKTLFNLWSLNCIFLLFSGFGVQPPLFCLLVWFNCFSVLDLLAANERDFFGRGLSVSSVHVLTVPGGFSPGAPVSTHSPKTCRSGELATKNCL